MNDETAEVRAAILRLLDDRELAEAGAVRRLGGLTNRVFEVVCGARGVVVRLPGPGTATYIDRAVEQRNAMAAAAAGVAPAVLAFAADGVMITQRIDALTMNAERFRDLGRVARAAQACRRLHECGPVFAGRFELFAKMDEYLGYLERRAAPIPQGFAATRAAMAATRAVLDRVAPAPVACHCDPLAENFLDDGRRMWIVDWEYSGNNDPMWDLGDLSVEAGFAPDQDEALLRGYFAAEPPPAERGRMVLYKAACDLLWTLWGVIQHVDGNPAEDFWAYAVARLDRCKSLVESEVFAEALAAAGRA